MQADLKKTFPQAKITLIEGGGGAFEVDKDGQRIFSKKKIGRFPESTEIIEKISGH